MPVRLSFACLLMLVVSPAVAQQSQTKSDRDKAGLRGLVKTALVEETFSYADGQPRHTSTLTKYSLDGRSLEVRTEEPDGSKWTTSYTYSADGRLLKTTTGNSEREYSTEYLYDDAKRLIAVKSGDKTEVRYEYDEKGNKSATETHPSQQAAENGNYSVWEGTDLGFTSQGGFAIKTLYNEQGIATGAKFYDSDGTLLGHITRKFDSEGHVISDEQNADSTQLDKFPEELRSKLNPEQIKAMGTLVAGSQNRTISYRYDDQGRVIEERKTFDGMEHVKNTNFNEQGDKASEKTTMIMGPEAGQQFSLTDAGAIIPVGHAQNAGQSETDEVQYSYIYDQYSNWTELTLSSRNDQDGTVRPGPVISRKLTYY